MRLVRGQREKNLLRSNEAVGTPEQKMTGSPSELLTPDVRTKLLEIKRGYEGGMIGDRIPPYINFLAASRRCWPELADELQIDHLYSIDVSTRIQRITSNLLVGGKEGWQQEYWEALHFLFKVGFIKPTLIQAEVQKNQDRLLELLDEELRGTKYGYILGLVGILQLGAPRTQPHITEKLRSKSPEILAFVAKYKAWIIGGLTRLFLPEVHIEIPVEEQTRLITKNAMELRRLIQVPNYGETSQLDSRLQEIFGLGAILADQVTLQPDGTIQYTYAKKTQRASTLPERRLT